LKIFFDLSWTKMQGKICLVTGANDGIGRAVTLGLGKMGATVILVCRNKTKGEKVLEELKKIREESNHDLLIADLSSMKEIKKLAKTVKKKYRRLDVLINNAGAFFSKRRETNEGFEMTLAVNYLSRFFLTNLLLGTLKASAPARIISVVGSHQAKTIDFDDFMMEKDYKGSASLARTTLANLLFMKELARRIEGTGVTANCVDPGFVRTRFVEKDQDMSSIVKFLFKFFKPLAKSPQKAAEDILYLAFAPELRNVSGKYFSKRKEITPSLAAQDEELAKKLWAFTNKLLTKKGK